MFKLALIVVNRSVGWLYGMSTLVGLFDSKASLTIMVGGVLSASVIDVGNRIGDSCSNLNGTVYISFRANTMGKNMN